MIRLLLGLTLVAAARAQPAPADDAAKRGAALLDELVRAAGPEARPMKGEVRGGCLLVDVERPAPAEFLEKLQQILADGGHPHVVDCADSEKTGDAPCRVSILLPRTAAESEKRVRELVEQMTPEEKIGLMGGRGFDTEAIPRLGVPAMTMADGPIGVRGTDTTVKATAFPAGIAMGATWDPKMVGDVAGAMAEEAKQRGFRAMLGPELNLSRYPLGGRNFETMGEDPYLTSRLTESYVKQMQGRGVLATLKHYLLNEQEVNRLDIDVHADDRTMHEIYLPAFAAGIDAGAMSVMASYNQVNGAHATENKRLLTDILRAELGFQGYVVSDWGATRSALPSAQNGLDLEMPWGYYFDKPLRDAVKQGLYPMSRIEEADRDILSALQKIGLLDGLTSPAQPAAAQSSPHSDEVALAASEESIVLLKNDGNLLPLRPQSLKSLAVIGPGAAAYRAGGGSSLVDPYSYITPLEGLRRRLGSTTELRYAPGVALLPSAAVIASTAPPATGTDDKSIEEAARAAAASDAAVVFVSADETEGKDRAAFGLPGRQDDLIEAVARANRRTVVVLLAGSPVSMSPWVDRVKAILVGWFPGQEGGTALARVLMGDVNPSGKLPVTFPRRLQDSSAHSSYVGAKERMDYTDGIEMGYRHFDKDGLEPLFPFGYGLSYTRYAYSGLKERTESASASAPRVEVSFELTNAGAMAGAEVVQLYVGQKRPSVDRPLKELKGFQRIELSPGEKRRVVFALDRKAFAFWHPVKKAWTVEPGRFRLWIGSSSRDLPLEKTITLR